VSLQFVLCIFTTHYVQLCFTIVYAWNSASNFFARLDQLALGRSKPKWSWQHLTTSILLVLNDFINRRFTTKSRDDRSDLSSGQASKPYSKIGIHYYTMQTITRTQTALDRGFEVRPTALPSSLTLTLSIDLWPRLSIASVAPWSIFKPSITVIRQ